jgi:hypothetical protein
MRRPGTRLVEYVLVVSIFLGSLALWVVVPFGSLWFASRMSGDASTVMMLVLIVCPVMMLAVGLMLGALYRAYLRVSGAVEVKDRTAWLGSLSGGRSPRKPRPILDISLTISASTAIVLLLVWFLFFAENYSPAGPVP